MGDHPANGRSHLFAALLLFAALTLAACSPNDRESCLAEAATKPSDLGVRVAVAACNRRFPEKPWEEYRKTP